MPDRADRPSERSTAVEICGKWEAEKSDIALRNTTGNSAFPCAGFPPPSELEPIRATPIPDWPFVPKHWPSKQCRTYVGKRQTFGRSVLNSRGVHSVRDV